MLAYFYSILNKWILLKKNCLHPIYMNLLYPIYMNLLYPIYMNNLLNSQATFNILYIFHDLITT